MSGHQFLVALHLLAIAAGFGMALANLVNMRVSKTQTGDIAKGLALHRMSVNTYLLAALVTILVTGALLLWQLGASPGPWFQVKMLAVLVWLVGVAGVQLTIRQMMKTGDMALMARVSLFAHIGVVSVVVALVCAVMAFKV